MSSSVPTLTDRMVPTAAHPSLAAAPVEVRRFPYPYQSLMAICSDLDETPDRHAYFEVSRFLNTTDATTLGTGVGLEVGNTIYFDMPRDQFSYWNTDDAGRDMVRALIRSGHIDCLHSFGDLATTRAHAARALEEMASHDCHLKVWIDHATAPSNFGADIMAGCGDVEGSPVFHADLTMAFGIRYVWRGRVTSVIGQGCPRTFHGLYTSSARAASLRTIAKEAAKGLLARSGSRKYAPHRSNDVLFDGELKTGQYVREFLRANPHPQGLETGDTGDGLGEVLSRSLVSSLAERGGVCILYTHLGKTSDRRRLLPESSRAALRHLADRQAAGDVLVTTTRRLLDYWELRNSIRVASACVEGEDHLYVSTGPGAAPVESAGAALAGLTLYVRDPHRTRVFYRGVQVPRIQRNPVDASGRPSVSVPWSRLEFPGL